MSEYFISYEVLNLVGAQLIKEDFSQFTGFVGWDFAFVSANWYRTLIYPTTEPDIMPPDESTSLMPEARLLSWRQRCCTHFSWGCFGAIVYFLLLLADVVVSIHLNLISSFQLCKKENSNTSKECTIFNGINTLNCLIFLIIVARSPRFVGCFTILKNLIRLPKFWILVFLLVLYIGGALLLVISSPALIQNEMYIGCLVANFLNVLIKVVLVGALNHVQVRTVVQGRSRFKYWLLKGTLVVIWVDLICSMIGAIVTFYCSLSIATDVNNSRGSLTLTITVIEVLLLPLVTKTTGLIWTKILQDNKCIIGKYESNSFTRQNSRISNAIEII